MALIIALRNISWDAVLNTVPVASELVAVIR
jgi:hypothetical protein